MKRCPQCNRTEAEETLTFCRADGTPLVRESGFGDSVGTVQFGSVPTTGETETRILPTDEILTRPTAPTTVLDARRASGGTQESSKPKSRRRVVVAAAAVLAVALAATAYFYLSRGNDKAIESVAVLPFVNESGNADVEYLSDGISENLINNLSQLPQLKVIARSSTFRYKGKEVDPEEVAKALGVEAIVTGRIVERGDELQVSVELVNALDKTQMWGKQYIRRAADLQAVQEEIAKEIFGKLQVRLSGEQRKLLVKRDTDDAEAYKLYLKGNYYSSRWTEEGFKKSVEHFNQAIDRDPAFAQAYAGLATTYVRLGLQGVIPQKDAYPRAKAAALKAVEIDDTLAEAYASLGFVKQLYDWDWAGARSALQRAIEINPNYAGAHYIYGYHLVHLGQFDEAIREIKLAQKLDPLSVQYMVGLADVYKDARRYDQAIEQCRKALEMDPNYGQAYLFLGQAYEYKGMHEEAIAQYEKAIGLIGSTPEIVTSLGHAYAASGKEDEARKVINDLNQWSDRRYVDPVSVAVVHAGLGEKDQAFQLLEKAYEERSGWLVHAKVEPLFDDLRGDPRFTDLLRRVGLPE